MNSVPAATAKPGAARKNHPRQLRSRAARMRPLNVMLTTAERLAGLGSWYWDIRQDRFTWSDETYRLLGLARADFDGTMESFLGHVQPDDRRQLRQLVTQVLALPRQFRYRYRIRGRDGVQRLIQGEGEVQCDNKGRAQRLVGTVMDITERERERKALRDSEARLRSLVQLSSDWVWELDANLRVKTVSEGPPWLPDYRDVTLGKRPWEVAMFVPVGWTWEDFQAELAAGKPFRDLELRLDDPPQALCVSISGEPYFDESGVFAGYRGLTRDITASKLAEQRLHRLNGTLQMAVQQARLGLWSLLDPAGELSWWEGGHVIHAMNGKPAASLDSLLQRVEPTARRHIEAAVQRCFAEGTRLDVVLPLVAGAQPLEWMRLTGEMRSRDDGARKELHGILQQLPPRSAPGPTDAPGALQRGMQADGIEALVTIGRDWSFTYLNEAAERLLRRCARDLVGRNLWEAYPEARGTVFELEYRRAMADGQPAHIEEFYAPLGQWLQVKAYPSPQGLAIYLRDITDSRSVHDALADSREELRNLFENSAEGVLYTSVDGVVARANPAACAMFGRAETELCGMFFSALLAPSETGLAAMRAERATMGRATSELEFVRADGRRFEGAVSSSEYRSQDGSMRAFVIVRDISARVAAEQQVLRLNADLSERVRQRTAELSAANAELQAFAHSLAHDLKSPAAAIDAFSEMLEQALPRPLPPRAGHYLGRIRAAARRTGEYAEGLLALAQATHGPLSVQRLDLSAMARDVLSELRERDPARKVDWQVQPAWLRWATRSCCGW